MPSREGGHNLPALSTKKLDPASHQLCSGREDTTSLHLPQRNWTLP
ncbi:hypothetical protein E2C01_014658 [Portunus trituberculatus]|uniref:Uncharacterized protein n=1 Tax=Portunus trituberculatus TaxID=210409 RepID=A0A5B7DL45_PORTR|nr:hypothetical protein [Portunus trituberculatus]